jgi:hypothetical protein
MSFSDVVDAHEYQREQKGAFEKETQHRMLTEAARYWVIEHYLRTGKLPDEPAVYFAYPNGPVSFDWGNPPGPDNGTQKLRGKRVRITMEIENG